MSGHPLAATWLKTVAEIAIRTVTPKQVAKTLKQTLEQNQFLLEKNKYYLLGIGNTAATQLQAWLAIGPAAKDHRAFIPRGYPTVSNILSIEGNRGFLGPESLRAGDALRRWLLGLKPDYPLVVFMSSGGQYCVETLQSNFLSIEISQYLTQHENQPFDFSAKQLMAAQWSGLKAGRGLAYVDQRPLMLVVQSDLEQGQEAWLSGGLFDPGPFFVPPAEETLAKSSFIKHFHTTWKTPEELSVQAQQHAKQTPFLRILAGNNETIVQTAAHIMRREGLNVKIATRFLLGDPKQIGQTIANESQTIDADVIIFGLILQQPTPVPGFVSKDHGHGQLGQLALAYGLAPWPHISYPLIAINSSGIDDDSAGAGVLWLPRLFDYTLAQEALDHAYSDLFFKKMGWLVKLPYTGAHVGQLVVVLKNPAKIHE